MENNGENSGPLTSLPVDRLMATDCNAAARAKIKEEQVYPDCMQLCNISSIWKKKNNKNDFESYRGIFRVTILRTILDKLIYNDEYETLDANLTDCNVGARKHRNIRDNIFVMNAAINS